MLMKSYHTTVQNKHPMRIRYLIIGNHFFPRRNIRRITNSIASICRENMLAYLSLDMISSSKLTVSLNLCSRKPVLIPEQKMFADEHLCIFSCQIKAFVPVFPLFSAEHIQSQDVSRPMKCEQIYLVHDN